MFIYVTIWKKNRRILEICLLSAYERSRHQNAKKHGKHLTWKNKRTLPKSCLFSVFQLLSYCHTRDYSTTEPGACLSTRGAATCIAWGILDTWPLAGYQADNEGWSSIELQSPPRVATALRSPWHTLGASYTLESGGKSYTSVTHPHTHTNTFIFIFYYVYVKVFIFCNLYLYAFTNLA